MDVRAFVDRRSAAAVGRLVEVQGHAASYAPLRRPRSPNAEKLLPADMCVGVGGGCATEQQMLVWPACRLCRSQHASRSNERRRFRSCLCRCGDGAVRRCVVGAGELRSSFVFRGLAGTAAVALLPVSTRCLDHVLAAGADVLFGKMWPPRYLAYARLGCRCAPGRGCGRVAAPSRAGSVRVPGAARGSHPRSAGGSHM